MDAVVVVAMLKPKAGCRDEMIKAIVDAAPHFHAEAGCELYALNENDECLAIVEKWRSSDDLRAHTQGRPFAELRSRIEGKFDRYAETLRMKAHPAGDTGKGAL